jgi:uncharacterized protein YpmB
MRMRKWMILFVAFLCIAIGVSVSVYRGSLAPKRSLVEAARERAEEQARFVHIDEIDTYYGENAYVVFVGTDRKGTKKIAWVPEKNGSVIVKEAKSGLTKREAIERLTAERNPKKIVSAKLGMEKGVPLWELTYIDEDNRYSFYYISFEDGTFLKRYSFQQ